MTFLSINAFIAYFLTQLHATTFEIGLSNALVSIATFVSQPYFAGKVMRLNSKKASFVKTLLTQRVIFLVYALCLPIFVHLPDQAMVILFLIVWFVFSLFVGSYAPYYTSLFSKMVAQEERGRLRGFSGAAGNLIALGSAYIGASLLKHFPFPYNYQIIFAVGAVILILDAVDFIYMRETPDVTIQHMNVMRYIRSVPTVLRENPNYRRIVLGYSMLVISQIPLAYDVVYGVRVFHAGANDIALFTAVSSAVIIVGNLVFGFVADSLGHRFVLSCGGGFAVLSGVIPLAFHSIGALIVAFAMCNVGIAAYNLSASVLIIENVAPAALPMCISVNTLITLVTSSVLTLCGSLLIHLFSYQSLFMIAIVAGLCASIILRPIKRIQQATP